MDVSCQSSRGEGEVAEAFHLLDFGSEGVATNSGSRHSQPRRSRRQPTRAVRDTRNAEVMVPWEETTFVDMHVRGEVSKAQQARKKATTTNMGGRQRQDMQCALCGASCAIVNEPN